MSQINANATILTRGIRALFMKEQSGMNKGSVLVDRLATKAPSKSRSENYGWLGQPPQMTEVDPSGADNTVGQAVSDIKALSNASYTITNRTYASQMVVSRADLEDDELGGLDLRIRQLLQVAQGHKNSLLTSLIVNGTTNTGYDNAAFFANSHTARKDEGGAQDNLLAGSGTSSANFQTDIGTGISTISTFVAENGEPFFDGMPQKFVLMAHPGRFQAVRVALGADLISNTSNVDFDGFSISPIFNARLADVDDWYLFHVGGAIMPLIWQDRIPLGLESVTDGERAVVQEQYIYKMRARYNGGYGFWQNAVKFVN